jgi:3-oxoacyl-[acyl-carrier protein] reductase
MKTALVTGASRRIGRATAQALARAGARVLVHYGNSAADADSLVGEIRAMGGRADALQADLGVPEGAAALANQVRSMVGDRLDILVANAGVGKAAAFEDHTIEDFDKLFATNVRGPFFVVQQLLPLLGEGSSVILVSSLAARAVPGNPGQAGAPSLPAYAATKALWTPWSSTGLQPSDLVASGSMRWPRALSRQTCPASPRPRAVASSP